VPCHVTTTLNRRKEGNLIIDSFVMWTAMSIGSINCNCNCNGGLLPVRRIIIKNCSDSNSRGFGGGADNNNNKVAAAADKKKKKKQQQQQQGYLSIYLSIYLSLSIEKHVICCLFS
jgi:hypothetical protein